MFLSSVSQWFREHLILVEDERHWVGFRLSFGCLGVLERSRAVLGRSRCSLGAALRRSWDDLAWADSWRSWRGLWAVLGRLGRSWGGLERSWEVLGDLGAVLEPSWGHLGSF